MLCHELAMRYLRWNCCIPFALVNLSDIVLPRSPVMLDTNPPRHSIGPLHPTFFHQIIHFNGHLKPWEDGAPIGDLEMMWWKRYLKMPTE